MLGYEPDRGAEDFIQRALGLTEELDGGLPLHGFWGSSGVYALLHSHALPVNIRAHRPAEHVE